METVSKIIFTLNSILGEAKLYAKSLYFRYYFLNFVPTLSLFFSRKALESMGNYDATYTVNERFEIVKNVQRIQRLFLSQLSDFFA